MTLSSCTIKQSNTSFDCMDFAPARDAIWVKMEMFKMT